MRHETFDRDLYHFGRTADPAKRKPGRFRRFATRIAERLANRRPDLRDFSEAQLRDIGLTRHDIDRF